MTDDPSSNDLKDEESLHIRHNLVTTAVNFLLNDNVKSGSEKTKIAFLQQKGLTEAEIAEAFNQAKSDPRYHSSSDQDQQLINPYSLPPHPRAYSFWSQLGRFSSSFVVLALALYGLHRFYKLYVEPWLFGTKSEKDKVTALEEQLKELNNSISQLKDAVSALEGSVNIQVQQIDKVFLAENTAYSPIPIAVAELKSEITNVKSLLINRHNFPAVPKVSSPSIPQWQLRDLDNSKSELKEKTENMEEGKSSSQTSLVNESSSTEVDVTQNKDSKPMVVENFELKNENLEIETNGISSSNGLSTDYNTYEPLMTIPNGNIEVSNDDKKCIGSEKIV